MKKITTDLSLIKDAVNITADRVCSTFGPGGENVLIDREFEFPIVTNDGFTVAKHIEWEDEATDAVARFTENMVRKVNDVVGDARTASVLFFREIFNAGYKFRDPKSLVKKNPMELKREIKEATQKALAELKALAQPVENLETLEKVAFAALEDQDLAKLVAKTVYDVGTSGLVRIQESHLMGVNIEMTEGMEIKSGYASRDMVNSPKLEAIVGNVSVLAVNHEIDVGYDLSFFLKDQKLVIFAPNFSKEFLNLCNYNRASNGIYILCIKINVWDKGIVEDIQSLVGDENVAKVTATSTTTTIIGGKGDTKEHLENLEAELEQTLAPFDKEKLKERIARVKGKVGIINVGAATDSEKGRLMQKVEDAKNATMGALEEGVISGGGKDLNKVAEIIGDSIITEALKAPHKQISKNMIVGDQIIDSYKSIRTALEIAATDAGNLLTCGTTIAIKNEIDTKQDK